MSAAPRRIVRYREHDLTAGRQRAADRVVVDDAMRRRVLALATDFPTLWRNPDTPQRERKRMLNLLVEDVTLIKQRQVTAHVRFRGGATTTLTLPRPRTAQELRATSEDVRREMNVLLDEYTDARVAAILNERGLRTGAGDPFDPTSVQWVRFSARLPSLKQRLLAAGMLTRRQLAAKLGVGRTTLGEWRICNDLGEWLYWPPGAPPSDGTTTRETPTTSDRIDTSTARGAV